MLFVVLATSEPASAVSLLRRVPGSWFYDAEAMWTAASTTTTLFFPMSEPLRSSDVNSARFAYQMTQDAGDCKLRAAVRFSNDGTTGTTRGKSIPIGSP